MTARVTSIPPPSAWPMRPTCTLCPQSHAPATLAFPLLLELVKFTPASGPLFSLFSARNGLPRPSHGCRCFQAGLSRNGTASERPSLTSPTLCYVVTGHFHFLRGTRLECSCLIAYVFVPSPQLPLTCQLHEAGTGPGTQ